MAHKFDLFRHLLFATLNESVVDLKFSGEEVKRIADYAKESYFKHLRLYDYVLNNKQLCEVKRVTINQNEPVLAPSLNEALILGAEETLAYEEDAETIRNEVVLKKQAMLADQQKRALIE